MFLFVNVVLLVLTIYCTIVVSDSFDGLASHSLVELLSTVNRDATFIQDKDRLKFHVDQVLAQVGWGISGIMAMICGF